MQCARCSEARYLISIPISSLLTIDSHSTDRSRPLTLHIRASLKPSAHKTLESRSDYFHLAPICLLLPFLNSFGSFVRSCFRGGVIVGDHYGGDYVCIDSGVGTSLMSTTAAAISKARASPFLLTLAGNLTFFSGLLAWALVRTMKVALNFFAERILFSCGRMPSSHSDLCMALTSSVAFAMGSAARLSLFA